MEGVSSAPATPHAALLLACARARLDEADRARIGALAGDGVDWTRFQEVVMTQRVVPAVTSALATAV